MSTTARSTATSSGCARSSRRSIRCSATSKPCTASATSSPARERRAHAHGSAPMDQLIEDKPAAGQGAPLGRKPGGPAPATMLAPAMPHRHAAAPRWRKRRGLSPLTVRILGVNVLALVILALGLLYLDRYQQSLTESEFDSLEMQARLIAGALGEGATEV